MEREDPLISRSCRLVTELRGNLFGQDKLTFEDRIAWVEAQLERMRRSARDPLASESVEFWAKAEEPWQSLSAILELDAAMSSGDPEAFVSSLPVPGAAELAMQGLQVEYLTRRRNRLQKPSHRSGKAE